MKQCVNSVNFASFIQKFRESMGFVGVVPLDYIQNYIQIILSIHDTSLCGICATVDHEGGRFGLVVDLDDEI